jgi:uncharacterized coiled-coil protein SlyX
MSKRARRLDDRIRELCTKAVAEKNTDELNLILSELQAAIREQIQRLRTRTVAILTGRRGLPDERRNAS